MKKLLAILLTLTMLLCMAAPAFAAPIIIDNDDTDRTTDDVIDTKDNANKRSINVTAIAADEDPSQPKVYSVELIWGDMAFAWGLNDGDNNPAEGYMKIWDPTTHTYTENKDELSSEESWYLVNEGTLTYGTDDVEKTVGNQGTVLIFNHSNAAVTAEVVVADENDADYNVGLTNGFEGIIWNSNPETVAGDENNNNAVQKITYTLTAGAEVNAETDKTADERAAKIYATNTNAANLEVKPCKDGDANLPKAPDDAAAVIAKLTVTLTEYTEPATEGDDNA